MHPLVTRITESADALADATAYEMRLEEQRPLVKAEAIQRLMQHGAATSATAAEKIVEKDPEYAAHRELQVQAVVARIRAWGQYEAAKAAAALPSVEAVV